MAPFRRFHSSRALSRGREDTTPTYRAYLIDEDDRVASYKSIEADTDAEAIGRSGGLSRRKSKTPIERFCELSRSRRAKMKTPPASEDTDGVFHAFTSCEVAALERQTSFRSVCSGKPGFFRDCRPHGTPGSSATMENRLRCFGWLEGRNALAILATVATVGATTMSARAEARGWRGG